MPCRSKRQRQLEKVAKTGREAKMKRLSGEGPLNSTLDEVPSNSGTPKVRTKPDELAMLLEQSDDALDTENEEIDPSFDLDGSIKLDHVHIAENVCEEWVNQLDSEDRMSLGLFLYF